MNKTHLFIAFGLGCIVTLAGERLLRPLPAQAAPQAQRVRWEYKVLPVSRGIATDEQIKQTLSVGNDGWEAVNMSGDYILFKRRR